MIPEAKRETIIDFMFNIFPNYQMPLVADIIIKDEELNNAYIKEKEKLKAYLYVENELLPFQREEVETRMKTDKQLVKDINLQKKVNDSMEYINLKNTLEEICNQNETMPQEQETIQMHSNIHKYKKWIAAASIALLLSVGGGVTYQLSNRDTLENRLYARYYEPFDDQANGFLLETSALSIAKEKYMEGEYLNALLVLKEQPETITVKTERDFYAALSLMETGRFDVAIDRFKNILSEQEWYEFNSQIRWYLGLSYLKHGNKEKAVESFKSIVNSSGYNYKKANKILKKLQ